jgi:macrolide transport system ATP-binding/permease protein
LLLINAEKIEKYYGDQLIFKFPSLRISRGERIGLVGPNGTGKTTLLNILAGEDTADAGRIVRQGKIAYIHQLGREESLATPKMTRFFALPERKSDQISGGEQIRIKLANALCQEPDMLIADEPTANLDYCGIDLLRIQLAQVQTLLLVSHDRESLNILCDKILHLENGELRIYQGNYDNYCRQRDLEKENEMLEYEKYRAARLHLEQAITQQQKAAKAVRKAPKRMGNSEARLHKGTTSDRRKKIQDAARSIVSRLEQLTPVTKPRQQARVKIDFRQTCPPENPRVLEVKHLDYFYENRQVLFDVSFALGRNEKLALWGPNGSGKTTLLRALVAANSPAIYRVPTLRIGYFSQELGQLVFTSTALQNVMSTSAQSEATARTVMARLLLSREDVTKPVSVLSGGERVKVAIAKLIVSNANALFLDEMTNYLDVGAVDALQEVLTDYPGAIILATHDSALIRRFAHGVLLFNGGKTQKYVGEISQFHLTPVATQYNNDVDRSIIEMRMAVVSAKIMEEGADLNALNEEFVQLQKLLQSSTSKS